MLSETHKLIANAVYNMLSSKLNTKMDYGSLLYGSIAPDLFPSMMFLPHTIEGSTRIVNDTVNNLCSMKMPDNKKDMKKYSFKLGLVVHFVSDYFCKAHNEKRYENLLIHYFYERKLKRFFEKRTSLIKQMTSFNGSVFDKEENIMDYLCQLHKEYNSSKRSMTNDFKYSIDASISMALGIIYCSLQKSEADLLRQTA